MLRRTLALAVAVSVSLGMGACTRFESTYMKKVNEADSLARQLAAAREQNAALSAENASLKAKIEKLNADLAATTGQKDRLAADLEAMTKRKEALAYDLEAMTNERDRLAEDNKDLEKLLQSKSGTFAQMIEDVRRKNAALETENARLKQDVGVLQKTLDERNRALDEKNRALADLQKAEEEKVQKVSKTYEDLLEKMKGEIAQGQVTISELKGKLTVNMVDAILFDSGKAEVKPEGRAVLEKVISILRDVKDKSIRIEGHTDNVQIGEALAKRYPTNWELSAARAVNVTRYLQAQGIDPAVLSAVGYGEYRPVAGNDTPEGKARNRRIEIILVPRE